MLAQPAERAGDLVGVGGYNLPVLRSDDLGGPPPSIVVRTGFSGTPRAAPCRSPRRPGVVQRARVQVGELVLSDPAGEASAPVQAALVCEPLESLTVGPLARDHDVDRSVARRSLEEQVDPLRPVEAVDRKHKVAVALTAIVERLRRVRKHLGGEPRRRRDPAGHVLGDREEPGGLGESDPIQRLDLAANCALLRRVAELPERRSVELVGLTELVDEPDALVGVAHEVRRELRRDHDVDPLPVRLVEVEHAPEEGLREHPCVRVPLERHRHEVGLVLGRT